MAKKARGWPPGAALLGLAAFAALVPASAWSLALRNSEAERVVDGLRPGRHYSLEELQHAPLGVENPGQESAEVALAVRSPELRELKDGFEPIPDEAWLKLTRDKFVLKPGGQAGSNVVLAIPDDRRLEGGQFQAQWISRAESPGGLKLDVRSKVLLIIPPDDGEVERARKSAKKREDVEFQLGRSDERADAVPLGRAVDLKRERGVSVKLVNLGRERTTFALTPVTAEEEGEVRREGFEASPAPNFLKPEARVVVVPAESIVEARLSAAIPDQARYRGRRWLFTVAVEPLESRERKTAYYRLWMTTSGEDRKTH